MILYPIPNGRNYAAVIIAIAIVTDILDGYLARRFGTRSDFGAFLDTTMDKVFTCPLLFVIAESDVSLLWLAVLVTIRDFVVTGVRAYAASRGIVIPGRILGKVKQILLCPAMMGLLLEVRGSYWFLCAVCVIVVVSGIDIILQAWSVLRPGLFPKLGHVALMAPPSAPTL
jgi:CDP-diacylglycerol--glycerol-3-phosphate 3-phosphatidyltransferase